MTRPTLILQRISRASHIPSRAHFHRWIFAVLGSSSKEITLRIVTPSESAALNKRFRGKKDPTNVLSFPNENDSLGDIVICAALVKTEARQQNKPLMAHWAHLTVHGVLHLMGYDHIREKEAEIMESREKKILKKLGFPNPYGENDVVD